MGSSPHRTRSLAELLARGRRRLDRRRRLARRGSVHRVGVWSGRGRIRRRRLRRQTFSVSVAAMPDSQRRRRASRTRRSQPTLLNATVFRSNLARMRHRPTPLALLDNRRAPPGGSRPSVALFDVNDAPSCALVPDHYQRVMSHSRCAASPREGSRATHRAPPHVAPQRASRRSRGRALSRPSPRPVSCPPAERGTPRSTARERAPQRERRSRLIEHQPEIRPHLRRARRTGDDAHERSPSEPSPRRRAPSQRSFPGNVSIRTAATGTASRGSARGGRRAGRKRVLVVLHRRSHDSSARRARRHRLRPTPRDDGAPIAICRSPKSSFARWPWRFQ